MRITSRASRSVTRALTPFLVALALSGLGVQATRAVETAPAVPNLAAGDFALEPDAKDHAPERSEIGKVLGSIEESWNKHNLDNVMSFYSDDYINNDGLDKKSVASLTQDFWKTYPDAKSFSKVKQVRIEGNFATIESRDMASGNTAKPMPGVGTTGELKSVSEGQVYMKRIGTNWRIIGDRIDYEKVRVAFGIARELTATFSAPEQVKSGHQYSAKLELALPPNFIAFGSITSQPLEYPQQQPNDSWRPVEGPSLERILPANSNNRNELLMATVGITDAARSIPLRGIEFLTRRLNVVPNLVDDDKKKTALKDDKHLEKASAKPSGETPPLPRELEMPEKPDSKVNSKDELKPDKASPVKPEIKLDDKTDDKPEVKDETKSDTKPETKDETKPDATPDAK